MKFTGHIMHHFLRMGHFVYFQLDFTSDRCKTQLILRNNF